MFKPCAENSELHASRAAELQAIAQADQDDRKPPIDWQKVWPRDEERRRRVGEIYGEGCFKDAADYAAGAIVFQHGVTPDHFFQTFLWSKRGVELGDSSQKWLMAAGIDRYLVNIGRKQLFATQASKPSPNACWCLEPQEKSFPAKRILEDTGKTVKQQLEWIDSLNQGAPSCRPAKFCETHRANSPKGTIPGFW